MRPIKVNSKLAPNPTSLPKVLKTINIDGTDIHFSDPTYQRALIALMNQTAVNGGAAAHWGGPSGSAEIISATHALLFSGKIWHEEFNFINDIGHAENGIYAIRANYGFDNLDLEALKGFRSIESKLTGHGELHLNPQGVLFSNGPLGSSLGQAQGICYADKLSGKNRTTISFISDGALMEGEAKEALTAIPGIALRGKLNPFILMISDNNTKLSGRISEDSFSMTPTFNSLEKLGYKVEKDIDGHNLEVVYKAIKKAIKETNEDPTKPIVLHFKTIKGKGIKKTEEASSGGHGYPLPPFSPELKPFLEELYCGTTVPSELLEWAQTLGNSSSKKTGPKKEKVQVGISKALIELAKNDYPIYSISSDLAGSTGLAAFQKELKGERHFDVGIAESNMISHAVGMSKAGFIPIVDTFAQFGVTKGNLPITMSSLSEAPIIAFFSHTGLQDAADGASHQASTYISALASIPNVRLVNLSCSLAAYELTIETVKKFKKDRKLGITPETTIFFLGRENFVPDYGQKNYKLDEVKVHKRGKEKVIFATAQTLDLALNAKGDNTIAEIISLNRLNGNELKSIVEATNGDVITIEDHQIKGGMGALISHELLKSGTKVTSFKSLGLNETFGRSGHTAKELYDHFEISL